MKALLLTVLAWTSKVPSGLIGDLYESAEAITEKNDANKNLSGWEKLKATVEHLLPLLPSQYSAIASTVVTIVVNIAVLVVRLRGKGKAL